MTLGPIMRDLMETVFRAGYTAGMRDLQMGLTPHTAQELAGAASEACAAHIGPEIARLADTLAGLDAETGFVRSPLPPGGASLSAGSAPDMLCGRCGGHLEPEEAGGPCAVCQTIAERRR